MIENLGAELEKIDWKRIDLSHFLGPLVCCAGLGQGFLDSGEPKNHPRSLLRCRFPSSLQGSPQVWGEA